MLRYIKENWVIILSLIYILSPIDFIPEILVGPLGLIDDLGVVLFLILFAFYREYNRRKKISTTGTKGQIPN